MTTQLELFVFTCLTESDLYPNWDIDHVTEDSFNNNIIITLTQLAVINGACFDKIIISISKSTFSREKVLEELNKIWQSVLLEMI